MDEGVLGLTARVVAGYVSNNRLSGEQLPELMLRIAPARVSAGGSRRWPSYERCVDGAPLSSEQTGPDISRADFVFCMTAITWGWSVDDTADRLMEESTKAQASGRPCADLTARNAALAVERRRQQPKVRRDGG